MAVCLSYLPLGLVSGLLVVAVGRPSEGFLGDGLLEVAGAPTDAGHYAGALERGRRLLQAGELRVRGVLRADRRLVRVAVDVERLGAEQGGAVGPCRLRRSRVGQRPVPHARRGVLVDDGDVEHTPVPVLKPRRALLGAFRHVDLRKGDRGGVSKGVTMHTKKLLHENV